MKTLYNFKKFVDEVLADNSRNYKISVLEKYKDDEDIKYYLDFVYNPYIITGLSEKKASKKFDFKLNPYSHLPEDKRTVKQFLDNIKINNTGRDEDIIDYQFYHFTNITKECKELFFNIITKNLQLGIDVKTINKIIPNLIPTFNVMLAEKYFDKPDFVEGKEFALTTKIDGGRIVAIKKNGDVKFYTRSGQLYEGLVDLEEEMKLYMPDNIMLDGEITLLSDYEVLYDPKYNEPCIGRKLTSKEQYKETMKITRKDGEKHGVKMLVFDGMTADEFERQECNMPYHERRCMLKSLFDCAFRDECDKLLFTYHNFEYFNLLPILYVGKDTSEINKWLNYNIEHGEEGIMINLLDAPYEFKRTKNLLKVKKFNSCDLRVLELEGGTNKNSDKLGAFICEYKSGNKVKVGSGISEEQRIEVWNNQDKYIGSIIEVSYFEETKNQNGGVSLRFPTFKDFRPDKSEPNY